MRLILLILALTSAHTLSFAGTYKCKQPDGKVTFQDQPCQGAATGSQIVVKPTAPSAEPAEIEKMRAANSKGKALPAQDQKAQDHNKAQNDQIDAYNKSVRCQNARNNLGVLKSQRPVYRFDNKGEKQYVDDANRQSEIAAAERSVANNCN